MTTQTSPWPVWSGQPLADDRALLVRADTGLATSLCQLGAVAALGRTGQRALLSPLRAHAALLARGWGVWAIWPREDREGTSGPGAPDHPPNPLLSSVGAAIELNDLSGVLAQTSDLPPQSLAPRLHLSLDQLESARGAMQAQGWRPAQEGLLGWWLRETPPSSRLDHPGLRHGVWGDLPAAAHETDLLDFGALPDDATPVAAQRWLEVAAQLATIDHLMTDDVDAAALALALGKPVAWLGHVHVLSGIDTTSLGDSPRAVDPLAFQRAFAAHLPSRFGPLRGLPLQDAQQAVQSLIDVSAGSSVAAVREACMRLLVVHPRRPDAWRLLGTLAQQSGQPWLATGCHARVTELAPGYADGWRSLGLLVAELGAAHAAIDALERALALAPHDTTVRHALARLLAQDNRPAEAVALMRSLVQRQPAHWDAHLDLGRWLLADDHPEPAAHHLQAALAGTPPNPVRTLLALPSLANALQRQGDSEGAAACLRQWLQLAPDETQASIQLARIERLGPQSDRATDRLAPLATASPDDALIALEWHTARRQALDWTPTEPENSPARLLQRWRTTQSPAGRAQALAFDTLWWLAETVDDNELAIAVEHTWTAGARLSPVVRNERSAPAQPLSARTPPSRVRIRYAGSREAVHRRAPLLAALLNHHDRQRFDIQVCCWTRQTANSMTEGHAGGTPTDALGDIDTLHDASDAGIAERLRAERIDLLIDLDGCGPHARPAIWQHRPAKRQVAWLDQLTETRLSGIDVRLLGGTDPAHSRFELQPGTTTPSLHLASGLVAVTPLPAHWLPAGSAHRRQMRRLLRLPEQAPVLISLAPHSQIDAPTWAGWMRCLAACPPAHLWLGAGTTKSRARLLAAARDAGIGSIRLHFIELGPERIAAGALAAADLYLCVAIEGSQGNTALLDALAAAVPAVCAAGTGLASRHASGLLRSAGLTKGVSQDAESRDASAISLVRNPRELLGWRAELITAHRKAPLFDLGGLASALETAFETALGECAHASPTDVSLKSEAFCG